MEKYIARDLMDLLPSIGQRISEVMYVKGKAFSVQNLASKVNIHRQTLGQMLAGKRDIYDFELKMIADALNVTVDQLSGEDCRKKRKHLQFLLTGTTRFENSTLDLALELLNHSIGLSDNCIGLIDVGRAYYQKQDYDEAHKYWLKAHGYASVIQEKFSKDELLECVSSFLELSCTVRKDFSNMLAFLEKKQLDEQRPQIAALNRYFLAKVFENVMDYEAATESYYDYLRFYELTEHILNIGRAKINVANFEYRMKNYSKADELYQSAFKDLETTADQFGKLLCLKGQAKNFMKVGQFEKALQSIKIALEEAENSTEESVTKLVPNFLVLLSRAQGDPQYATKVLGSKINESSIKNIARKYLVIHYLQNNDPNLVFKYLKEYEGNINTNLDILDEGEL